MVDERQKLISELKQLSYKPGMFNYEGICDFILQDRKRVVEPLVKLEIEIDAMRVNGTFGEVQAHFNQMRRDKIKEVIKSVGA